MLKTAQSGTEQRFPGMGQMEEVLEQAAASPSTCRRVFVSRDFYATAPDQLSVFIDDSRLQVIDDSDGEWWMLRDGASGQQGRVPAEIIEEGEERQARMNCTLNNSLQCIATEKDVAVNTDPRPGSKKNAKEDKKLKKRKDRVSFDKKNPEEIPKSAVTADRIAAQLSESPRYVEYDPKLEQELSALLTKSLQRMEGDRLCTKESISGQFVRVYAGISLGKGGNIYKSVLTDDSTTIGEMALIAGHRFSLPHSSSQKQTFAVFLRHCETFQAVRLDPKWHFGSVVELAKVASFADGNKRFGTLDPDIPKQAAKYYGKMVKKLKGNVMSAIELDRRTDLDFCTKFQFVLERVQ